MFSTFNMGIGMALCVKKENTDHVLEILKEHNEEAYIIGYVDESEEGVIVR